MRERQLIDAIHRRLPKTLHRQSMTMGSLTQNGTPDYFYDGPKSDLWIEYKQLRSIPRDFIIQAPLTELQRRWLNRRYKHGQNVRVVVGLLRHRAVILHYPAQFEQGISLIETGSLSYDEVARWISDFCGCSCGQRPL